MKSLLACGPLLVLPVVSVGLTGCCSTRLFFIKEIVDQAAKQMRKDGVL